jgi:hypothetical protein
LGNLVYAVVKFHTNFFVTTEMTPSSGGLKKIEDAAGSPTTPTDATGVGGLCQPLQIIIYDFEMLMNEGVGAKVIQLYGEKE